MAIAEAFESLQPEQIPLYKNDSSEISSISSEEENDNIENVIEDNSKEDIQEYTPHEQHRLSLYATPEPPTPEPLTPARKDTCDKKQKLRRPTLYNTPKSPTPKPFTPLEDRIAIFLQTPIKEVIPSPELGFIKRKTRRSKAVVIQTAASTHHKRLKKER